MLDFLFVSSLKVECCNLFTYFRKFGLWHHNKILFMILSHFLVFMFCIESYCLNRVQLWSFIMSFLEGADLELPSTKWLTFTIIEYLSLSLIKLVNIYF